MDPDKTLFSVMKEDSEKTKIILENTLIMLGNRIFIDKNGDKNQLLDPEQARKSIEDKGDGTYIISANDGNVYAIKIIFQKISATGKQSTINDFFKDYAKHKKIIISRDYNNKIVEFISKHRAQIFKEDSLLFDIIKHRDQPKYELLSPSEIEQFKSEYNATEYTTKKLLRTDPASKYYALRRGDVVRIIRSSPTSGQSIDYRIVV